MAREKECFQGNVGSRRALPNTWELAGAGDAKDASESSSPSICLLDRATRVDKCCLIGLGQTWLQGGERDDICICILCDSIDFSFFSLVSNDNPQHHPLYLYTVLALMFIRMLQEYITASLRRPVALEP
jgi:hypothetical protein